MSAAPGIVVIGGGIAGQALCEELRRRDAEVPLALVCGERHAPYDRVRLSHLLAGDEQPDALRLRPDEWYADRRVRLLLGRHVTALDPDAGTCTLDGGGELGFTHAALCTGSDPLLPPLAGLELDGVHPFRTPDDCTAIAAAAAGARAVVIGGGLLGLEAAYGLCQRGAEVTVVHLVERLMERQLDAAAAQLLLPAIERLGVDVRLSCRTQELTGAGGRVTGVRFADGGLCPADVVVVSVGIRARTELAAAAGLQVGRGIVVDDRLRTSHQRVVAVGECAEHRGVVYGIVAPIHEQAAVAADTLLGREGPGYGGSVPAAKLKVMGIDLVSVGAAEGARAVVAADADSGVYRKLVVGADGRAAGAVLLGDARGHELLSEAVRGGQAVEDPLALLAQASQATAEDLPDAAQVCNCNGVCKREIVDAVRVDGCASAGEVMTRTRAATGCGSCKQLVVDLVALASDGAAVEENAYLCPCRQQTREQLAALTRERELTSVSELAAACGAGRDCGACKPGLAYLVSEVAANRHREERHARFINDRVHANIQKDGTFSVVPRIRGGVTTPHELRRIADVAERHEVPMVKITGGQRIDLLGIRKEQLPRIWEELGMPSGHAYAKAVRTVKTCVGTDFCRFGLGDAIAIGIELERRMEGLYTPHKVKSAVSGCPRNCAEAYVKDIGLVAVEGGWEVYVGGAAGSRVRKGDLLATVTSGEEAMRVALTFLQLYREQGEYLERTCAFVERVGMAAIATAVLDEHGGEPARLRERLAIAKAAAEPDPWLERHDPVHPKQFAELDTSAELLAREA